MKYAKIVTGMFLVLAVLSAYFLITYWDIPDEEKMKKKVGSFGIEIRFVPVAEINSPTIIFGDRDTVRGGDIFFANLVKRFWFEYEIKASPGITGDYSIKTYLKPSESKVLPEWKRELPYSYEGVIESQQAGKLTIDIFYVRQLWDRIQKETGLNYNTPIVEIETTVSIIGDINGEKIKREYRHVSSMTVGKTLKFGNLEFSKSENIERDIVVQNYISTPFGNAKPSTIKTVLAAVLITSISAIIVLNRKLLARGINSKINNGRLDRRFRKKYDSLIVQARKISPAAGNTVFLRSLEDVGKIAYELESPIIETDEYLAVMSNGNAYIYRKGDGYEKKK
ncbi:DUF5305 family protein [Geoglobus acetivorans]|uniref:DUF5305 domain-containing protein n=1 Tax=Geoglobus acetivorans TaxID=565033 RepID=A0A0A7GEP6_GEOAI|nr:hypothetical protein GACE_1518 [Geoglobus acetivorans]